VIGFFQESRDDVDLTARLAMPVNRIAQYEYLLRALADQTPEGIPERDCCENAFAALAQSSLAVQTSLVESAETALILTAQRKLKSDHPLSLAQPGRRLLGEFKFKKHFVCIFNDIMVIARAINTSTKTFRSNRQSHANEVYKVQKIVELGKITIADTGESEFLKYFHLQQFIKKLIVLLPEKLVIKCTADNEIIKLAGPPADKFEFLTKYNEVLAEINRAKGIFSF
jgi:hypothetical protein